MKYPGTRSESVVQIVFAISFGVVMCIAVDLQARHHVEDTDAIKSQMDAAARVADEIIQMSGALSEKFDSARESGCADGEHGQQQQLRQGDCIERQADGGSD